MVEQLVHVAREAGDAVAVMRFGGAAVTPQVERHHAAIGSQVGELVAEHRLRLAPPVEHDQREPIPAAVLVGQLHTVVSGKCRHRTGSSSSP